MRISVRRLLPNRIDRYVLGEVLGPFLGGTVFILFVLMMFQALRLTEFFVIHGVGGAILGRLSGLLAISFLPTALPIAFLIAVLVAFGRLSADSELVAMKASGMSLWRLSIAPLMLAIAVMGLSFSLNMDWAPWSEREFKDTFIKVSNTKVLVAIKQGTFNTGFFDLLIFAEKVDQKTNRMEKVFIYDDREHKNPQTIVAQSGEIVQVKTNTELGMSAMLKLYDGSIHHNDLAGNTYQKIDFGEYGLYLKIDEGSGNNSLKPRMYSHDQLVELMRKTRPDDFEGRETRGEYWRRIAAAVSPILFLFLGIGFGTVRTRAVRAGAALTALVVFFGYWGAQTAAGMWMQKGWVAPWLAMQIPNLAMALLATISFRRAAW